MDLTQHQQHPLLTRPRLHWRLARKQHRQNTKLHSEPTVAACRATLQPATQPQDELSFLCFFFFQTKTPLDKSLQLNNTNPPAQNGTTETQGSMRWRTGQRSCDGGQQDTASWWKQSEERPAVDSTGKQQIHLHFTQHKYLYGDLYSHSSYIVDIFVLFPSYWSNKGFGIRLPTLLHLSYLSSFCFFLTSRCSTNTYLIPI